MTSKAQVAELLSLGIFTPVNSLACLQNSLATVQALTPDETELRAELKHKCLWASLDRTISRQSSRVVRLAEGDANTKYFHLLARGRKRRNHITQLKENDTLLTTPTDMAQALFRHFVQVFGQTAPTGSPLDLEAMGIAAQDLGDLTMPVTEDEVWAAIKELPADRAPGLDGYTGAFYKASWQTTSCLASTPCC